MPILVLVAPVSGPLFPLEQVPDPVFAGKLVGDGISIDPVSSTLVAPCDAEVLFVHTSGHAVTLRAAGGVEILLHIGLDTVTLRGEGFLPLKKKGDRVRTGEPLIAFAADYIVMHAPSLLTQMVIATPDRVSSLTKRQGYVEAGRDVVLEAVMAGEAAAAAVPAEGSAKAISSRELLVRNPTGLHARPAALLASTARQFRADVRVRCGAREASARSVTAIMSMEIGYGERIVLTAAGDDARAALDTLVPLVEAGLGEHGDEAAAPGDVDVAATGTLGVAGDRPVAWIDAGTILRGTAASPGVAIGQIVLLRPQELTASQREGTPDEERRKLDAAVARARRELETLAAPGGGSTVQAGIFRAHLELLEDPDLVEASARAVAGGTGAAAAWERAFSQLAERMAGARSELFAQRATDVRDVGRRVLRILSGAAADPAAYPEDAIVVAHDLTPSETATFDRGRVRGFCTITGGKTSHVAILARSFGIPAITGIDPRALELTAGTRAILDGSGGSLLVEPSADNVALAVAAVTRHDAHRVAVAGSARQPAITLDGLRVEVAANIGTVREAADAVALGADGVGLFRSEFLFMDRPTAPDEDEQYEAYAAAARAFTGGARVIIRTLDVGGDKPLAYLPLAREDNPFLGIRGIRIAVERADLLRLQLRAILRASREGPVQVMFPMVTTLDDWRLAKRLLDEERAALGVDPIAAGIMVEVPAVALTAESFAAEADFFSIGTNDLTQYTLAMDRGHPALAAQVDALHPSVLRLISLTVKAARAHGRWVGVCGALASEDAAVAILLGLGVDELSVSLPVVASIKARVRSLRLSECQALAERALQAGTAAQVRDIAMCVS